MTASTHEARWILGFDGGCSTCSALAGQLVDISDGRLTARSLRSCEVRRWREQAMGADAPWVPTLLAVDDDEVRAWTGPAMAWRLAGLLGLRKTWRVARMLGEFTRSGEADKPKLPSRRRALKALGGAAVVFGIAIKRPGLAVAQEAEAVWTVDEPDAPTHRRMEEVWRSDELRAYHAWLDDHGYRPEAAGAPSYAVVRRGGNVAYKSVSEVWKENGRRCAIVMAIGANGRTAWKGLIFRDSDGELLRRLHVNNVMQVEDEVSATFGCPNWLPCPDPCKVCKFTCGSLVAVDTVNGELGLTDCLSGCTKIANPYAAVGCGGICLALVAAGQYLLVEEGCPTACELAHFC